MMAFARFDPEWNDRVREAVKLLPFTVFGAVARR